MAPNFDQASEPATIVADRNHVSAPAQADRTAWLRLLEAMPSAFLSPTFAAAVEEAAGGVRICHLSAGERVVGIFPFQYPNAAMRLLRAAVPVGNWMSDCCGVVADPRLKISSEELLRRAGLSHFGFSHLPEQQLRLGLGGEQPRVGLRIEFREGSEQFWKERRQADVKFVRDCERRQRKLVAERGPLRFAFDAADDAEALERLIRVKREQYARTGVRDSLAPPWVRALLLRLHRTREPDCTGLLSTLYAGETWVASHFGLRHGGLLHYWLPVYNPEINTYGPGRLLLMQIIESGAAAGLQCIDRGEGDTPAKRDFATAEQRYYLGAWARGLGGIAARAVQSAVWRLEALRQPKRSPAKG